MNVTEEREKPRGEAQRDGRRERNGRRKTSNNSDNDCRGMRWRRARHLPICRRRRRLYNAAADPVSHLPGRQLQWRHR